MGKLFESLDPSHIDFILCQQMFFVGSAADGASVNISPKGLDTFRVLDTRTVAYLDLTGSGNETAAHLRAGGRVTVMFCAFEGKPLILRLYGRGKVVHPRDPDWANFSAHFPTLPGTRQIVVINIDRVQTSCGMAVPHYEYVGRREELLNWADKKGPDGLRDYWESKNQRSIDGLDTGLLQ